LRQHLASALYHHRAWPQFCACIARDIGSMRQIGVQRVAIDKLPAGYARPQHPVDLPGPLEPAKPETQNARPGTRLPKYPKFSASS